MRHAITTMIAVWHRHYARSFLPIVPLQYYTLSPCFFYAQMSAFAFHFSPLILHALVPGQVMPHTTSTVLLPSFLILSKRKHRAKTDLDGGNTRLFGGCPLLLLTIQCSTQVLRCGKPRIGSSHQLLCHVSEKGVDWPSFFFLCFFLPIFLFQSFRPFNSSTPPPKPQTQP